MSAPEYGAPECGVPIEDPADPRLADFCDLTDADVRPDRRGIVIAEGVNVVQRLLRSGYRTRAVVGVAAKLAELAPVLAQARCPVFRVDKWTLSDLAGFRVTRGVLASADRPVPVEAGELVSTGRRFVVCEAINDFENLGSIFRNCAAFGIDAVLLDPQCADPLYRRSVRVSMGNVFGVDFAVLPGSWPDSLQLLVDREVELLALTPRPAAQPIRSVVPAGRWAVLLGAEGPGLSDAVLRRADRLVRIPMAAGVDSLNVATAGAVALAYLADASG